MTRLPRLWRWFAALLVLTAVVGGTQRIAQARRQTDTPASETLSSVDAVILGAVEGITEYLPVSSTGHLVVAERALDLGQTDDSKTALDAYTVIIQFGAILAVLILYRKRVGEVLAGLVGRSESGRRLLINLVLAFIPAAIVGLAFSDTIDEHLLKPTPVAVAWIVGGIAILVLADRLRPGGRARGDSLDLMVPRQALLIGVAQALALWPGMSRSLVTIVGGVLVGMGIGAAVEFSFLLGLLTLTAATALAAMKDGSEVIDTYGKTAPLIGIVVAGITAAFAVKSFVAYLQKRSLKGFGWYRIAIGVVVIALVATGVW